MGPFIGKGSSDNVIIWLLWSEIVRPKAIQLSGAYCIINFIGKLTVKNEIETDNKFKFYKTFLNKFKFYKTFLNKF
jgi:hypothetical protein